MQSHYTKPWFKNASYTCAFVSPEKSRGWYPPLSGTPMHSYEDIWLYSNTSHPEGDWEIEI